MDKKMIGIDIVSIERIEKLHNKWGDKYLKRFLKNKEIDLVKRAASIAGFWAAKEAASKALGTGIGKECNFYDIKLNKLKSGQPTIKYSKKILKKYKIKSSHLTISHDNGLAVAVVVNTYK
jgi:holo-[acyl-carrier protein] synthase